MLINLTLSAKSFHLTIINDRQNKYRVKPVIKPESSWPKRFSKNQSGQTQARLKETGNIFVLCFYNGENYAVVELEFMKSLDKIIHSLT